MADPWREKIVSALLGRVKGEPIRVFDRPQALAILSDKAIDTGGYNMVNVQVYVMGAGASVVVSVEGSSEMGGNYLPLDDPNASKTLTANGGFDVITGTRWSKIRLASLAAGTSVIVWVTPYISPGQPRIRTSVVNIYDGSTEVARLGNLNGGWGYVTDTYGLAIGEYGSGKGNIVADVANGIRIRGFATTQAYIGSDGSITAGAGAVTLNADGITINTGSADVNSIKWKSGAATITSQYSASQGLVEWFTLTTTAAATASHYSVVELIATEQAASKQTRLQLSQTHNTPASAFGRLDINGDIVWIATPGQLEVAGFKMNVSPTSGYLLTSDVNGVGTWQAAPAGGITQLTADVTAGPGSGSQAATIAAGAVSLTKMANLAANSIIGNNTGGSATPLALTAAQVKSLLAISSSDVSGLGSLATLSTVNNGNWSGTALAVGNGGTGQTTAPAALGALMKIAEVAGTSTPNITLSSIPATYKHLVVIITGRSDAAVNYDVVSVYPNADVITTGSYTTMYITTALTATQANGVGMVVGDVAGANATANQFGHIRIDFPEYATASVKRGYISQGWARYSATAANQEVVNCAGEWDATTVISSLRFSLASGNWTTTSIISLYGVPA